MVYPSLTWWLLGCVVVVSLCEHCLCWTFKTAGEDSGLFLRGTCSARTHTRRANSRGVASRRSDRVNNICTALNDSNPPPLRR